MMVSLEFLQHQGGSVQFQPAPANSAIAVRSPLLRHHKAQAIHIKAERRLHVGDSEKGHRLLHVELGFCLGCHLLRASGPIKVLAVTRVNTAPSHVAAMERMPSGGPVRLPSMIADPAYHLSRPSTASTPVKRSNPPSG